MLDNEASFQGSIDDRRTEDVEPVAESPQKKVSDQSKETTCQNQSSVLSQSTSNGSETKRSRSSKKVKKRHGRQKSQNKADDALTFEKESSSHREDDATMSGTDQVLSCSSRFASPEDSRNRKTPVDSKGELSPELLLKSSIELGKKIRRTAERWLYCSSACTRSSCTSCLAAKRDPAAQFLVVSRSKDTIGFRSFTAGGKLLQFIL